MAKITRPPGTKGRVTTFRKKEGGPVYASDQRGNLWRRDHRGYWIQQRRKKSPTYGRFTAGKSGRGGFRAASFYGRFGSGASYAETVRRIRADIEVEQEIENFKVRRRERLIQIMGVSATNYAAAHQAPVLPRGYEWCHLVAHGLGGEDEQGNLVAGSTYANSEQLMIERVLY